MVPAVGAREERLLRDRIDLLRSEIGRLEEALRLKDDVRNAADSLFKF